MKNVKFKKVIVKVKPITKRDKEGNYIIFDENNEGGAIISGIDPFQTMNKFKEATLLSCAVRTLMEKLNTEYQTNNFYVPEFV